MMTAPLIGITLAIDKTSEAASDPAYAIQQNYCQSVSRYGGLPMALPHENDLLEHYVTRLDGLVVTGAGFDVPPALCDEDNVQHPIKTNAPYSQFEFDLAKCAYERSVPMLGICGGQQLLSVIAGATLIKDIPRQVSRALSDKQSPSYDQSVHEVDIVEGTLLHRIVGKSIVQVNSQHHQASKDVMAPAIVNARAKNGAIEGVEFPQHPFCLGVVWHPEHQEGGSDERIFSAFVDAARQYRQEQ